MDLDEQSNSGFPVALSAPGPLEATEKGAESPLALSLEACTGSRMHAPRMHAPNRARPDVDWAVVVLSLRCAEALDVYPAPLSPSNTTH